MIPRFVSGAENRTEQNRTEQNRTEQNRTEQIIIPITLTTIFLKTNYVGARCYWIFGDRQQFCVNDDF
ncbi:hypothetical protein BES34_000055 [Leptospira inadai serovar Lyme]|uniref:Lipoprotein n=1 Tax=Leptospira inadai serovar Lyme TaxID=293084 RepID=A0ABX4YNK1_9LEPT|nr:hypothetical protein BES34_000055 [Leptospira inadai serovar Lyme]